MLNSNTQHYDFNNTPWNTNTNTICLGSTLKFFRNIEKFHFPAKLDSENRKQVLSLIQNYLVSSSQLQNAKFLSAETISPQSKEYLFEHYLAQVGFHQAHAGEGFVVDDTGTFLAVLNIRNHIQLKIIDIQGNLEKSWEKLTSIESELGKCFRYAYSRTFGFLTANPKHSGTAFQINAFLNLPALIFSGQLEDHLKQYKDLHIAASGMQGDPTNFIGDIVNIHNSQTLGLTESDIITNLQSAVTKLTVVERSLRTQIQQEPTIEIQDYISRAFGLLKYAHKLETIEALNALSACKLALDINWLKGTDHINLNSLLFQCRRAHLIQTLQLHQQPENLLTQRANFIQEKLKDTTLTIS